MSTPIQSPSVRSGGESLSADIRARLAPSLGFDPTQARVHTDEGAASAARSLDADAFTVGRDIYFGEGRFNPQSRQGKGLLAHELTHVGQQTSADGPTVSRRRAGSESMGNVDDDSTLNAPVRSPGPSMLFAARSLPAPSATAPPGSSTVSESDETPDSKGDAAPGHAPAAASADPRAVADQVYALMRDEILLGRQRGILQRRRQWR